MPATDTVALRLVVERHEDALELKASGELDAATGVALVNTLVATLDVGCTDIRIDLSGVSFLDTAGLAAIERCRDEAWRRASRFSVVQPRGPARLVIDLADAPPVTE
jgi:anti-anti-sigma factor